VRVEFAGLTDPGRVRKNNEDSFALDQSSMLGVVCDGVGGQAKGEVASALAVDTLKTLLAPGHSKTLRAAVPPNPELTPQAARLAAAVRLAALRVQMVSMTNPDSRGMTTTIVAMLFGPDGSVSIASVGDSRAYRLRQGTIHQLTRDHTYVNELLEDKAISAEDVKAFGQKNVISRALGDAPTVKVDIRVDSAEPGDIYLLCSDGLHGVIADDELAGIVRSKQGDFAAAAQALIDEANRRGGPDNITVVIAGVYDAPSRAAAPVKLELTDDRAEVPGRSRVLRKLYKIPGPPAPRWRLPVMAAAAVLLAATAVWVWLYAGHRASAARQPSYLVVAVQPREAQARLTLNGRPIQPDGEMLNQDSAYTLEVEAPDFQSAGTTVQPGSETTRVAITLRPAVIIELRYNNQPAEAEVALEVRRDGREVINRSFKTADLVGAEPQKFQSGPGVHSIALTSSGRAIVNTSLELKTAQVLSIVPDRPVGQPVQIEAQR
jgi:protein phosphatase